MAKVKLTQIRSTIGQSNRQRETMKALGLRRINHSVVKETSPQVLGMIKKVSHLLKIEE